jgi:hypothetical protein
VTPTTNRLRPVGQVVQVDDSDLGATSDYRSAPQKRLVCQVPQGAGQKAGAASDPGWPRLLSEQPCPPRMAVRGSAGTLPGGACLLGSISCAVLPSIRGVSAFCGSDTPW